MFWIMENYMYLEFPLVIVEKCKCDFGVLYVRYSLMSPGIPKLGGILSRVRHFMNCPSAMASIAFSLFWIMENDIWNSF